MKTKFRQKPLWKNFCIFFITLNFHSGLCRPSLSHADTEYALEIYNRQDNEVFETQVKSAGGSENHTMLSNDTLPLYSHNDFIDFLSNDVDTERRDEAIDDDAPNLNDVNEDVISNKSPMRRHQESPFTDRNLVRKRRHPEPHKPHRRRRRKHRLVLKARDRNHLSNVEEDLKDRRDRFLIKSDSPAYVITSASEVKKDWCRTIPLKQKISEPNCRSRVIQNNFCYGQCNSFFIPHTDRTDNKVAFQSCAFCKPLRQHWGNVTLNCPGKNPPKIEKTVLFVETCRCITEVFQ